MGAAVPFLSQVELSWSGGGVNRGVDYGQSGVGGSSVFAGRVGYVTSEQGHGSHLAEGGQK
jgi:hypothetical protein